MIEKYNILWYLVLSSVLILLPGYSYISSTGRAGSILGWMFSRYTLIAHLSALNIILFIPLLFAKRYRLGRTAVVVYGSCVYSSFQLFILLDSRVFQIFKYHINGMVLNVVFTPAGLASLELPWYIFLFGVLTVLFVITFNIAAFLYLSRFMDDGPWFEKAGLLKKICIGLALFLLFSLDKLVFCYADYADNRNITKYEKTFPLYFPLRARRIASVFIERPDSLEKTLDSDSSMLNYPLSEISVPEDGPRPNILIVLYESFRPEIVTEGNMPNLYEFSRNSSVFTRHYSGGNCTRFGVFSIFYGLYGIYWNQILHERRPPVLMDVLRKRGYSFHVYGSAPLTFPELRSTVFLNLPKESIKDRWKGDASERDRELTDAFIADINSITGQKPFFSFIFFDSSHGAYPFPEEFRKYTPVGDRSVLQSVNTFEEMKPLYNRYRNSLYYDDALTGRILDALEEKGGLSNTVVIISGDHGEEFRENGFQGHTSAFTEMQTHVPMIMRIPGRSPETIHSLTSHNDIPATLLQLLGSKDTPASYSFGLSMLDNLSTRQYVVASGWDECAILDRDIRIIFGTEIYRTMIFDVRDSDYRVVDDPEKALEKKRKTLVQVLREFGRFMK